MLHVIICDQESRTVEIMIYIKRQQTRISITAYKKAQNKDIQKCNFHYKTVRRFLTEIAGSHVLSKCPKERHSPPWNIKFSLCFQGGDCLSLGHLQRTWRTEKSLTRLINLK